MTKQGQGHPLKDEETLIALLQTMNDTQLAAHFGFSRRTIDRARRKFNLPRSIIPRQTKYQIDQTFFSVIDTPEKAYILGLIVTDGSIWHNSAKSKRFEITLKESDRPVLEAIRNEMQSTHPVKATVVTSGYSGAHALAKFSITNMSLVNQLEALGLHPNKTDSATYPPVPLNFESHLIRGMWDGDGYIGRNEFVLIANPAVAEGVQDAVRRHTEHSLRTRLLNGRTYLYGSPRDAAVLHWIYQDAGLYIQRKMDSYRLHWFSAPRTESLSRDHNPRGS